MRLYLGVGMIIVGVFLMTTGILIHMVKTDTRLARVEQQLKIAP